MRGAAERVAGKQLGQSAVLTRLVEASYGAPRRHIAVWAGAVAVASFGIAFLEIDTSTSSFLDRTGPAWQAYQDSVALFGGDEFLVVAHEGREQFDPAALHQLYSFSKKAEGAFGVRRVDSLATVPLVREGQGGAVLLDPILTSDSVAGSVHVDRVVDSVRRDLVAPGSLVSRDERVFAANVVLDRNVDSDRGRTVDEVRSMLSHEARVSGVPIFRTAVNARTSYEAIVFAPVTVCVIGALLWIVFRKPVAVLLPVLVGGVGSIGALGAMGAVGVRLSLSTLILPSVLLALGCAYTMHALAGCPLAQGSGELARLRSVARPVALSGVTTAIGFLAMATVKITAIRELSTFGALGVAVITAAVLTLVPAVLALSGGSHHSVGLEWARRALIPRIGLLTSRWRTQVISVWLVVLSLFAVGLYRLQVSTDIIQWFPVESAIRSDYERIKDQLSGISPVNVVVSASPGSTVLRPDTLSAIHDLTRSLGELPQVGKALSIGEPLEQLQGVLSGVRALPESEGAAEQYLLLLDSVAYLRDLISLDRSSANIVLRVDNNSSSEIVELGSWIDSWWERNGPVDASATTTGIMYEFGRAEEQIAYGQIKGLVLAFVAVGAVLLALLRDVRLAVFSLLPNAVPLGIAFGTMGLLGIPLDAATVCLGSLALGIAVDDTIHIVVGYHDQLRSGEAPRGAVEGALGGVLPALILSTATIAAGFAVLGLSDFTLIRNLGLVTSALVVLCLIADLTLLPALLSGGGSSSRTGD